MIRKELFLAVFFCLTALASFVCAGEERTIEYTELETVWDLEDTLSESAEPLCAPVYFGGGEIGFDRASNTYFCPIGIHEEWPDICLTIGDGFQGMLTDDYQYDMCREAVREGTRYELFICDDKQYCYAGLVFTGLPQVILASDTSVFDRTDVPAAFSVLDAEGNTLTSDALVHKRGGAWGDMKKVVSAKQDLHIELHRTNEKGKDKKNKVSLLGMGEDSDWLLISCISDVTCLCNYVAWQFWNDFAGEDALYTIQVRLAEVFLNDEYIGIYQIQERIRTKEVMKKLGTDKDNCIVGRLVCGDNGNGRPRRPIPHNKLAMMEMRSRPEDMTDEDALDVLMDYWNMVVQYKDYEEDTFCDLAERHIDIRSGMQYWMFTQLMNSWDSFTHQNNTYIWAVCQPDGTWKYYISPWDLDNTGFHERRAWHGEGDLVYQEGMELYHRIFELDLEGSRKALLDMWKNHGMQAFSEENIWARYGDAEKLLTDSGAYAREGSKWRNGLQEISMTKFCASTFERWDDMKYMLQFWWPVEGEDYSW